MPIKNNNQKLLHDLYERIKELNCLYGLSNLVENIDISLEGICQGTVNLLPPSWQYPKITCARILFKNEEFKTANFKEIKWRQSAKIKMFGKEAGFVEVRYLERKPDCYEGPFLKEERSLINAVAQQLSKILERKSNVNFCVCPSADRNEKFAGMYLMGKGEKMKNKVKEFMDEVISRNPGELEFHQAVQEVVETLMPFIEENPKYQKSKILERMVEPERVIIFRVPWMNDKGEIQINRGFRIEMNSAIGPYKGGLRFHPSVNLGVLKFLAFEQVFKNSLTTLPMGGGKGGADFDPKGKSDNEVMMFCQSFMTELQRHIGPDTDVPAGDIGVGGREIGYLFGQYKRLRNEFTGVLTGKGLNWGGSLIRPEATGYGCVYFVEEMLKNRGESLKGKVCAVSGAGNVAQYTVEKLLHLGAKVVTLSDSKGFIYDKEGIDEKELKCVLNLKNVERGRLEECARRFSCEYHEGKKPWSVKCDVAFPSATQNEISGEDAEMLVKNGCIAVGEGANMPTTPEGVRVFQKAKVLFAPGKAANAGGVATSGLEMSQNSMRLSWPREEVDAKLQWIMRTIHENCLKYGKEGKHVNYVKGANIAGFVKVADSMIDQGLV